VLAKGKWRADGGASLRTFFLNYARYSFQAVYRRWQRDRKRDRDRDRDGLLLSSAWGDPLDRYELRSAAGSPEAHAIAAGTIEYITKGISTETEPICWLIMSDYTYAQIGAEPLNLGLSGS
jgi:hypothetical protein